VVVGEVVVLEFVVLVELEGAAFGSVGVVVVVVVEELLVVAGAEPDIAEPDIAESSAIAAVATNADAKTPNTIIFFIV
jgi:hypothetical protein